MTRQETVFKDGEVVADRYEIVGELGRGSYGVVYRAIQLGIQRVVALKTLLPQIAVGSEEHQRFEREALLVSRLSHPNIITLFDYGKHHGVLFMVMEYVEGRSLGDLIRDDAPLAPEMTRGLVYQMLDALQFAHDQGVVHRDLKPENIKILKTVSIDGEEKETLKILDFGIGKFVHGDGNEGSPLNTLTQTGIALGTPQYMSPENITGDPVSHHADLYAAGLILYEMLTGEPAFTGATPHAVMVSHIRDPAPRLPETEAMLPFQRAVEWSLRKQPDERAPSARALRELLEEDDPRRYAEATRTVGVVSSEEAGKRNLRGAMVAILVAAILVLLLLVLVLGSADEERSPQMGVAAPFEEVAEPAIDAATWEQQAGEPDTFGVADDEVIFDDKQVDDEAPMASEPPDEPPDVAEPPRRPASEREGRIEPAVEREVEVALEDVESGSIVDEQLASPEVVLDIRSQPEGAMVTLDGTPIGTSPVQRRVRRGEATIKIGFSMIGYRDTVLEIVPDEDQTAEVRLERARIDLIR